MAKQTIGKHSEQGFTLVELAIVMIIIGILIGGVLKGQELINNARVQATVAQVKGIDGALSTFRDMYRGLPGDITRVSTRIPNCTGACNRDGSGDNRIGDAAGANSLGGALGDLNNENGAAWAQLIAADVLTGVTVASASNVAVEIGVTIPEAEMGGGIEIGYTLAGNLPAMTDNSVVRRGHYLLLDESGDQATTATTGSMTPNQAERIDVKLDDGRPNTGSVRAIGSAGNADTDCADATGAAGIYFSANDNIACGLYIRVQG